MGYYCYREGGTSLGLEQFYWKVSLQNTCIFHFLNKFTSNLDKNQENQTVIIYDIFI